MVCASVPSSREILVVICKRELEDNTLSLPHKSLLGGCAAWLFVMLGNGAACVAEVPDQFDSELLHFIHYICIQLNLISAG